MHAALKMFVIEDGTAHDGERGVGTYHIIGKDVHEVGELSHRLGVDVHRHVVIGNGDAVFVVISVGRILHEPVLPREIEFDRADVFARGMRQTSLEPLVFLAEQAFGVFGLVALFHRKQFCDLFVVLFRFGKVDGDFEDIVSVPVFPFEIFIDSGLLYVVVFDAHIVKIRASRLHALAFAQAVKLLVHL